MENIDFICNLAEKYNLDFKKDVPLKAYTTFKTGGNASAMIFPKDTQTLSEYLKGLYENGIRPFFLGNGSNLLVSDKGFDGVVIHTGGFDKIELSDGGEVKCGAGVSLMRLCRFCLENSLTGLEFAFGIPGSVGGAVYMNAGAYGGEMKDVILSVSHIDTEGHIGSFGADELDFSYRHSIYSGKGYLITDAVLKLSKGSFDEIKRSMDDYLSRRKSKQPLEYPSAGSTFKRPVGHFAGALIEQCGLKGKSIGGAQVSEKHAGFIINKDDAAAKDITDLIKFVQDTVFDKTGVRLETEIIKVGE